MRQTTFMVAILSVVLSPGQRAGAGTGPAAREIAERSGKAYAACQTYRDAGTVTAVLTGPDGKSEGQDDKPRQLTTAYRRGGAFRFEYRDPNPRGGRSAARGWMTIVWAKGEEVKVWPEDPLPAVKPEDAKSVHFALAVRAGVTEGVSMAIPLVLLPTRERGTEPGFVRRLKAGRRLGDERVGKADCFRVQDSYDAVNFEDGSTFRVTETYWIDRKSYLVRRLRVEMAFNDRSKGVTTVEYDPAVGVKLGPAELEFRPPKQR